MEFLLVSGFAETGTESGANRLRKLASGLRSCGHSAGWLGPRQGFFRGGMLGKLGLSLWMLAHCLRWARRQPQGWVLVSLPPPWLLPLAFVLALVLPKRLLLDFRDPLLNQDINPRAFFFRAIIRVLQDWTVRRARLILVAAPGIARYIHAPREKVVTVLGAVAESEARELLGNGAERDKSVIVYGGSFYGSRSPRPLLEALAEYQGSGIFEFYVSFNDPAEEAETKELIAQLGLDSRVRLRGQLPRAEFMQRLRRAGGGLVITHSKGSDYAIPGKIFDYLTAGVVPWVVSEDKGLLDFLDSYGVDAVLTRGWAKAALLEGLERVGRKMLEIEQEPAVDSLSPLFESRQAQGMLQALQG